MPSVTRRALAFIDELRRRQDLPEHFGVRLFAAGTLNGPGSIQIGFSEAPLVGDVVDRHGTVPLFVASEVQKAAAELVLDVEGNGTGQRLVLRRPGPG